MKAMMRSLFAILLALTSLPAGAQPGEWSLTEGGLPMYRYTGALPFETVDEQGNDSRLPEDPYFLTGNYRLGLFTHVSGIFQFMTAERVWARINFDERQPNYGANEASVTVGKGERAVEVALTGVRSIASDPRLTERYFGAGFARYEYKLDNNIKCVRTLSVRPSLKINSGTPSFLISVTITNSGEKRRDICYRESMPVNYVSMNMQLTPRELRPLKYPVAVSLNEAGKSAVAEISVVKNTFLELPPKGQRYIYDVAPPTVFMQGLDGGKGVASSVKAEGETLSSVYEFSLRPGESRTVHVVIGLYDRGGFASVSAQTDDFLCGARMDNPSDGAFAHLWEARLPDFAGEKDETVKREMLWNAHMVEASAKYSEYYEETFIPQGSVYSYHYGDNIANRDHIQASLAACYTNPALAKSALRYVMKHTEPDGEIKRGNTGFGYTPPTIYKESDQQIYLFDAVSEYLRITGDYNFLDEQVDIYPAEERHTLAVIDLLKRHFIYLRDEVGVGPTGLVRLLNSDWADSFLHRYSPNVYQGSAESHMNSAMVLSIFPCFIEELEKAGRGDVAEFTDALKSYRARIERAFMADFGERKFSARAYLDNNLRFGLDNVCIEPQSYLLQIPSLSAARKREIYDYIKPRISAPEKIGVRNREKPLWDVNRPQGEDGGIWYSLQYPFLLGVATFDKAEAKSLLSKFSFDNYAKNFPGYWIGHWTAPDEINSSLYREGLYAYWIEINNYRHGLQGFCSHPHTWPLYCYYRLNEQ